MLKYSVPMRMLHWLTALLIIGLFAVGLWMRSLSYYDSLYQILPFWHKSVGFLLLLLVMLRLVVRFSSQHPAALPSHKWWERRVAGATVGLLYGLMFGMFISGYLIATADDRPASFFGWFDIPVLITAFPNQEDVAGLIHEYCAWALIGLSALHGLAALKHHFLDKDVTLKRML
ncbi:cytochrome b [Oceanisphaera profunda]|uniref:Cytochrome b n=1 Tax=Oceanisphaera profunda TaxID=1416627 RepID=A0A1Y0D4B7_9GAMM|nr:cytochrome b [Oceanisphaera profunda]ART82370.1 cytochrome b [Oceanisphaera profunda]